MADPTKNDIDGLRSGDEHKFSALSIFMNIHEVEIDIVIRVPSLFQGMFS